MVVVSPGASKRHNRLARILATALDATAGPDWNADTDSDVRLQDVPLTNRRPDVVVYRADTIDVTPTRPQHVLLVVAAATTARSSSGAGCATASGHAWSRIGRDHRSRRERGPDQVTPRGLLRAA
nr:Uma2 family endonuclease [Saccharothrix sp. ST-888]